MVDHFTYLVGHLVPEQRPPTVLNTVAAGLSRPDSAHQSSRSSEIDAINLDIMTLELRDKSKELLAANLSQTKHFFKKLKRYINFLSTPSESVAECRVKQMLASKITREEINCRLKNKHQQQQKCLQ